MPTRNVVLTDHHERLIASGRYQNASEGLRLIETRDAREAKALQALREAVAVGVEPTKQGDVQAFSSFEDLDNYMVAITDPIITGS